MSYISLNQQQGRSKRTLAWTFALLTMLQTQDSKPKTGFPPPPQKKRRNKPNELPKKRPKSRLSKQTSRWFPPRRGKCVGLKKPGTSVPSPEVNSGKLCAGSSAARTSEFGLAGRMSLKCRFISGLPLKPQKWCTIWSTMSDRQSSGSLQAVQKVLRRLSSETPPKFPGRGLPYSKGRYLQ